MIYHSEPNEKAEYLLVQYMEDSFRRELRNVGVVVRKNSQIAAHFLGETAPGAIDGRKTRGVAAPDVYRQWVQYWRKVIRMNSDPFAAISRESSVNYKIVRAGDVLDTGDDDADAVCRFLYSALVSEAGFAAAFDSADSVDERAPASPRLSRELESEFRSLNILGDQVDGMPLVRYPIRTRQEVRGATSVAHKPQFTQQNGLLYVMETVDFFDSVKDRARDHAGLTAYMFGDISATREDDVYPIAVVRYDSTAELEADTIYGLSMLRASARRVVNWSDAAQRTNFVDERRAIAMAAPLS